MTKSTVIQYYKTMRQLLNCLMGATDIHQTISMVTGTLVEKSYEQPIYLIMSYSDYWS